MMKMCLFLYRWPDCSTTSPSLPFWMSAPVPWVWMWRIISTATAGRYDPTTHHTGSYCTSLRNTIIVSLSLTSAVTLWQYQWLVCRFTPTFLFPLGRLTITHCCFYFLSAFAWGLALCLLLFSETNRQTKARCFWQLQLTQWNKPNTRTVEPGTHSHVEPSWGCHSL